MMHIVGRNVIVRPSIECHTEGSLFNGKTGEVIAYRFDMVHNRVALLIRFGERLGVFYHDEVKFSPEEIRQMDAEVEARRQYLKSSIED